MTAPWQEYSGGAVYQKERAMFLVNAICGLISCVLIAMLFVIVEASLTNGRMLAEVETSAQIASAESPNR